VVSGRRLDTVTVEGNGPIGRHVIDLALQSGDAHADVGLAGDWKNGEWRGRIERLDLEAPPSDRWSLTEPAPVLLTSTRVQVEQTCLHSGASQSCVNAEWRAPQAWSAKASLERMPLAVIAPALPPAFGYRGQVDGDLDVKGNGSTLTGVAANLSIDPGTITKGDPPQHLLGWDRIHAEAALADERLTLTSSVTLGNNAGEISLEAALHSADLQRIAQAPIEGRIAGLVTNVPLIKALTPDLAELRGETRLDLRIAGTLVQPEVYGDASIQHGAAAVPRLGVSLQEVMLAVHGDGRTLELDGEAHSGTGKVVFSGMLTPGAEGWQGNATISGQDFRLIELPEITGDISPDVRITLKGRSVRVEGDVSVPRANVAPRDLAGAVRVSPDAVVVGPDAQAQEQSPWLLDAQLRLILGADVTFHGFGLDADIGGSVVATDKPGLPTTGTGELNVVQGTYTAYGRQLTIDHGRLLFNGGLIDNPALDARASRHLEEQSVGVDVRGTLRKPELRLYSDPPLSQSDALAYLLIGRPVGSLSGGEQAELADTTRQIGISGAGFLAQQVGRRIGTEVGIEEVGMGEENREERTALFIGKYLSPKLYIGYGVGLFETVNTWRVRYFLTPRLLLQAESGREHSADVIYSIDR
jgi:translocation and assembly module TamB